jgi:spermidine synthase
MLPARSLALVEPMAVPWKTVDSKTTPHGILELRERAKDEFLITLGGRILMNSRANRSEVALAKLACDALEGAAAPNMLIGGLGMGCTLRAAAEALPDAASIQVSELTPIVERWCRGELASVNNRALEDPRVEVLIEDVSHSIAKRADAKGVPRYDAIMLDLFEGPHSKTHPKRDPFYGTKAIDATRRALTMGGLFAVWSETPDAAFEKRLKAIGFSLTRTRPGKGGLRHAVYLAKRTR